MGSPTIYEIAKEAGVSITTVSRVINNNYPVSDATRKRVMQAVRRFDYLPSQIARSLATKSTGTIGVMGLAMNNPYFVEMMDAIQEAATEMDLHILLQNARHAEDEEKALRLLIERRVEGVIMVGHHEEAGDAHIVDGAGHVPIVMIGHDIPNSRVVSLRADEDMGMEQLVRMLMDLGHRHFLFLGGLAGSYATEIKLRGLRRALGERDDTGFEVAHTGYAYESGQSIRTLVSKGVLSRCTAILAISDWVAIGALDALHELQLVVPDDVTVTGFDNVMWCRSIRPALTSVEPNKRLIAEKAVDCIVSGLTAKRDASFYTPIQSRVVLRKSHGPANIGTINS